MPALSKFATGFRLFAGESLNALVAVLNNLTGFGTAGPLATNAFTQSGSWSQMPTSVVAAGATQGGAALLASAFNIVTVAASTQGVILPTAATGKVVRVSVGGTVGVKVYPSTADKISTAATNVAVLLAADKTNLYIARDAVTWLVQKGA